MEENQEAETERLRERGSQMIQQVRINRIMSLSSNRHILL